MPIEPMPELRWYHSLSTRLAVMVSTCAVLLVVLALSAAGALIHQSLTQAQEVQTSNIGKMFGAATQAALAFGDVDMANGAIEDLAPTLPGLLLVEVYDADGERIGQWTHDDVEPDADIRTTSVAIDGAEKGTVLGTVRVGMSTERLKKAERRLACAFAGILGVASIVCVLIAHQVARSLRPVRQIADVTQRVAAGDLQQEVTYTARDEVGILAASFRVMTRKIQDRERRIQAQVGNMRSLLQGMDEGLLFFDREGTIASERSQALSRVLPGSESIETVVGFLSRFAKTEEDSIEAGLEILWLSQDDAFYSPFETSIMLLPQRVTVEVAGELRTVRLTYHPYNDEAGELQRVYLTASDVTEELRNKMIASREAERVSRVSKAASNTAAFQQFVDESTSLFHAAYNRLAALDTDVVALKRELHTIKGNVATYAFQGLASDIHRIEDMVEEADKGALSEVAPAFDRCKRRWRTEVQDIRTVLGLGSGLAAVNVRYEKIHELMVHAAAHGDASLVRFVEKLVRYPLAEMLGPLAEWVQRRNTLHPDMEVVLAFDDGSTEITVEEAQVLTGIAGHLVRNAVDHAFEPPSERVATGKPPGGTIRIGAERATNNMLNVVVSDDGRGISGDELARRMVERGSWSETQLQVATAEEKLELVFVDALTTRDEVTETSGRGVGMAAVRRLVTDQGGSLRLISEPGRGTRIELHVREIRPFPNIVPGGDRALARV